MKEVPLTQGALFVVHDRDALAEEDEEILLHRFRVIAAIRLARLHHLDVDARVGPRHAVRFEPDEGGSSRSSDRGCVGEVDHIRLVDPLTIQGSGARRYLPGG